MISTILLVYLFAVCGVPPNLLEQKFGRISHMLPIILSAGIMIAFLIKEKRTGLWSLLMRCPITYCFIIYFLCGLLALPNAEFPEFSAFSIAHRFVYAALSWLIFALLPKRGQQLLPAYLVYLIPGLIFSGYTTWDGYTKEFITPAGDAATFHHNTLVDIAATSAFICFGLFFALKPLLYRIGLLPVYLLNLAAMVASQSRGGLLSFVAGSTIILSMRPGKYFIKFLTIFITIAVLLGGISLIPESAIEERTSADGTVSARPFYWNICIKYMIKNPLRPVGWGNIPPSELNLKREDFNYCNWFLEDYCESGPVGALASVGILILGIYMAIKNHLSLPEKSPLKFINSVALAIFVSRYLHGSFDTYWSSINEGCMAYCCLGIITFFYLQRMEQEQTRLNELLMQAR